MKARRVPRLAVLLWSAFGVVALSLRTQATESQVDEDATVHVPSYLLLESSLLSVEARGILKQERADAKSRASMQNPCPSEEGAHAANRPAIRQCEAEAYFKTPDCKHLRDLYRVVMTPAQVGGVYTEIFVPAEGIAPRNSKRVLINLHGGGFQGGTRTKSYPYGDAI